MKAFITGATGFVGQAICRRLLADGHTVVGMGRNTSAMFKYKNLAWIKAELEDSSAILEGMSGCTHVFHCGALARVWNRDPSAFFRANVSGTENVLDAARRNGIERLVFTSTAGVIGRSLSTPMKEDDPRLEPFDNDYDLTKHLAEQKVLEYASQGHWAVIVRPSRIYGSSNLSPSNAVTNTLRRYLQNGYYLVPTDGSYMSNYVYIDDVVDGHLKAISNGINGEAYILGGENLSYNDLFNYFKTLTGVTRKSIRVSPAMASFASYLMLGWSKLIGTDPFVTPSFAKRIFCNRLLSSNKARDHFGYTITPMAIGLQKTLEDIGFSLPSKQKGKTLEPLIVTFYS